MAKYNSQAIFHVFNSSNLQAITEKLKAREAQVASSLVEAINAAAEEVVRLSSEEWNSYFQINRRYIRDKIGVISRATRGREEAVVAARARATRANNFKYSAQPDRQGVHLNLIKSSGGGVLGNAFVIPNAKSNNKPLIMERLKKYQKGDDRRFTNKRFKALYGPSVNQHFTDSRERVAPKAMSAAKEQFLRALEI